MNMSKHKVVVLLVGRRPGCALLAGFAWIFPENAEGEFDNFYYFAWRLQSGVENQHNLLSFVSLRHIMDL